MNPPRAPSATARALFFRSARRHPHLRTVPNRELQCEQRHAATDARHQHALARPQSRPREHRPKRRKPGKRQRRRFLPRKVCRLRRELRDRHRDFFRKRPNARRSEDRECSAVRMFVLPPVETWVDDHLTPDPAPVNAIAGSHDDPRPV